MKPFYKETFLESWRISTSKRYLWPLGLLASLLGLSTTFRIIFDLQSSEASSTQVLKSLVSNNFMTDTFVGWSRAFSQIPWAELQLSDAPLLGLILLLFAVIILIVIVAVSAQAGMIKALEQTFNNKKTDFFQSFGLGVHFFWEVFIFSFFLTLFYLYITAGLIVPLTEIAGLTQGLTQFWLSLVIFFILVPTLIVLDIIVRYAIFHVIILKKSMMQSWHQAWTFFKQNWLVSLETAFFILLCLLALAIVVQYILLPIIIIIFGFFASLIPDGAAREFSLNILMITIFFVLAVAMIFFSIFYHAVWTKIFLRLQSEPHLSKVQRSTRHLSWLHRNLL